VTTRKNCSRRNFRLRKRSRRSRSDSSAPQTGLRLSAVAVGPPRRRDPSPVLALVRAPLRARGSRSEPKYQFSNHHVPPELKATSWKSVPPYSTDTAGVTLQGLWGDAAYIALTRRMQAVPTTMCSVLILRVIPPTQNGIDPTGTPEDYKTFVIFCGTGGGLTNYTGFFTTGPGVVPTIAPISASPTSLVCSAQPGAQPLRFR
jgi:hypothetical protein